MPSSSPSFPFPCYPFLAPSSSPPSHFFFLLRFILLLFLFYLFCFRLFLSPFSRLRLFFYFILFSLRRHLSVLFCFIVVFFYQFPLCVSFVTLLRSLSCFGPLSVLCLLACLPF